MTRQTLEYAPFRLNPGVTEEALRAAAMAIQQEFLGKQPGYLRRDLVKDARGYVDLIWWSSAETASAAMSKAVTSPACSRYFALMDINPDDTHEGMQHLEVVESFGSQGAWAGREQG